MQTPGIFEQISGGITSTDSINRWLSTLVPSSANAKQFFTEPPVAWLANIQSVLKGSDAPRHMQIDAIHNAQKRTTGRETQSQSMKPSAPAKRNRNKVPANQKVSASH